MSMPFRKRPINVHLNSQKKKKKKKKKKKTNASVNVKKALIFFSDRKLQ